MERFCFVDGFFADFKKLVKREFDFVEDGDFKVFGSLLFWNDHDNLCKPIVKTVDAFRKYEDSIISKKKLSTFNESDLDITLIFEPRKSLRSKSGYGCDYNEKYTDFVRLLHKYFLRFEEIFSQRLLLKFNTIFDVSIDLVIKRIEDSGGDSESDWVFFQEYFRNVLFPFRDDMNSSLTRKHRIFFINFVVELKLFLKKHHLMKLIFGYLNSISIIVLNLYLFKKIYPLHKFSMKSCFLFFFYYFNKWNRKKKIIQINKKNKELLLEELYSSTAISNFHIKNDCDNGRYRKLMLIYTPVGNHNILKNWCYYGKQYILKKFSYFLDTGNFYEKKKRKRIFFEDAGDFIMFFKLRIFGDLNLSYFDVLKWKGFVVSRIVGFLNDFYLDSYSGLYGGTGDEEDYEFLEYVLAFPKCFQKKRKFYVFFKMKMNEKIFSKYYKDVKSYVFCKEKIRISEYFIEFWKKYRENRLLRNINFKYIKGMKVVMKEMVVE